MKFECDKVKAKSNFNKHGIRFTEACKAIKKGYVVTQRSPQSDMISEERNLSITRTPSGRTILVVWTERARNLRIISARVARSDEREAYDAYLKKLH